MTGDAMFHVEHSVLMRECPACGNAYGEHTLVSLAECIDGLFLDEDREEASDVWWDGLVRVPNLRPVEDVVTDLL